MYKKLNLNDSAKLLGAGECIMLSACSKTAKDITPIAWNMPVNDEPAIVAAALDSGHFITELILESKEFCICIPDMAMLDLFLKCGSVSGRKSDKFEKFNIEYEKCENITAPKVKGCAGYIECRLKDNLKYDGVDLVIGEVVNVSVKAEFFEDGCWDTEKFKSIHSIGSAYGASLGKRFKF